MATLPWLNRFSSEVEGYVAGRTVVTKVLGETTDDEMLAESRPRRNGVLQPFLAERGSPVPGHVVGRTVVSEVDPETTDDEGNQ